MPVLNEDLYADGNTIIANMGNMKRATYYTIEVSRDTFQTIEYTFDSDTSFVEINENTVGEELLWYTIYQVRATAHAADSQYDSHVSDLGSVRTQKYPSNQGTPDMNFDVTDTQARVFWSTSGSAITKVKVFTATDLRLENPLIELTLTEEEVAANEAFITGLTPDTKYQIAIYSEGDGGADQIRGWEVYTTKVPLVSGDNVYDLSGIDNENILMDTLGDLPSGSIVIIEPGRTYLAGGYSFASSVKIMSGYGFVQSQPLITCTANYNIAASAAIDSIVFENVEFSGDFAGNYVFNIDQSGTIGAIRFNKCTIHSLRGITRIKGGTGTIDEYTVSNTLADSINGYGVFYVDVSTWTAKDVNLENSTFSKCQYFLASRTNTTGTITIESCTIDQAPEQGRQMFRWRGGDGNNNVLGGVKIHNTIWGPGWNMSGAEVYAVLGVEGLASTTFDIVNVWTTSEFSFSGSEIGGFPAFTYSGTAGDLWTDRDNMDYSIADTGFSAKNSAGDPRWRPGL